MNKYLEVQKKIKRI